MAKLDDVKILIQYKINFVAIKTSPDKTLTSKKPQISIRQS